MPLWPEFIVFIIGENAAKYTHLSQICPLAIIILHALFLKIPTSYPTWPSLLLLLMWILRGAPFSMEPTDSKAHV